VASSHEICSKFQEQKEQKKHEEKMDENYTPITKHAIHVIVSIFASFSSLLLCFMRNALETTQTLSQAVTSSCLASLACLSLSSPPHSRTAPDEPPLPALRAPH
jgi:hypothetical protein